MPEPFGSSSKARLEAVSSCVIVVTITIMVLGLKAPGTALAKALVALWPNAAIDLVSFVFVAIYWINHHGPLNIAQSVTPTLIWTNNALLFFLSLFPFATTYIGNTDFHPLPTTVYAFLQFLCGLCLVGMMITIVAQRTGDAAFLASTRPLRRKNAVTVAAYGASVVVVLFIAIAVAYVTPTLFAGERPS
jgi:uncharacterized membrane protein